MQTYLSQFGILDKSDIEAIMPYVSRRTIKRNQFLIQEGLICNEVFFVEKGILRNFIVDEEGNETTYCLTFGGQGATAYSSFLSGNPTQENIQAITDVEGLVVSKSAIERLAEANSNWMKFLKKVSELEYERLENRIFSLLKDSPQKRYLSLLKQNPTYVQQIPLHYLASYLGISQRHLTRLRREILLKK
ncbi:MAG: Crp/Fnr family transcriptional regulator [Spirosomataceae bacterium]